MPRPDPPAYAGHWKHRAREIAQRAHFRWLLVSAQAVAGRSLPDPPPGLADRRSLRSEAAWHNLDELAREFLAVTGAAAHIDPLPAAATTGRFRVAGTRISMDARMVRGPGASSG